MDLGVTQSPREERRQALDFMVACFRGNVAIVLHSSIDRRMVPNRDEFRN